MVSDSRSEREKNSANRLKLFGTKKGKNSNVVELDIVDDPNNQYTTYGNKSRQEYVSEMTEMDREAIKVAEETSASTKRSKALVQQTRQVGIETNTKLSQQTQQLEKMQDDLIETNATLDKTDVLINKLENPFTHKFMPGPRKKKEDRMESAKARDGRIQDLDKVEAEQNAEGQPGNVYEILVSPDSKSRTKKEQLLSPRDKAKLDRMRRETAGMSETELRLYKLRMEQDEDIKEIGSTVGELKSLASNMNKQLTYQNEMIDNVQKDVTTVDRRLHTNNKRIKELL